MALLKVEDLKVHFPIKGGFFGRTLDYVRAVDGVSFELQPGETYGIVGESGSGKSTTGKAIMHLTKATEGSIHFNNRDLTKLSRSELREQRKDIQMIFQDPYSSLNPKKRVMDIIAEPLRNFEKLSPDEERRAVQEHLDKVGLNPESIYKYPHEFSGGQRQRIGIARALTLKPKLIIADEPVSALDVSVQAQVLNFLQDLQAELGLTYLFISHDLGVIRHMCDRIGVMYRGRIVEEATSAEIYSNPQHIYTKRLISAIPDIRPENREKQSKLRREVNTEYEKSYENYFNEDGRAYDLKPISPTHRVALP
ncbi:MULTISPECIES: ABC transporter ATP-binding protein [Bacillus]|uniref:Oligopeptide ABC transporter, ATP-binding protein n=1 Tax=Bacillus thuringiensis subsp. konkukian (strain 97-27) TaxID=281309 RepID=Q6HNF5_BACHK|nr:MULTISPECIES: ATP-binding cassette domain-containing protein [Bacillus]AAT59062.1 oligopeptide ABC transporter, ATP-binding protein [[Bacillus thuringiensis] serovar konkukian str. 97-27]AJI32273.1 ABC transporter family protein [Bacillus thuringiensis]MCU5384137.1 ATP-binding cassette domain-containing protein [Bacillus cereus]MDA2512190.1 ATP-binding cassette domain-containing protein [Bacillus cereus]MDA2631512.1 ATP-binding cassette domain-containing protein [Bacillus cereus]